MIPQIATNEPVALDAAKDMKPILDALTHREYAEVIERVQRQVAAFVPENSNA